MPSWIDETRCHRGFGGKPSRPRWRSLVLLSFTVVAVGVAKIAIRKHAFVVVREASSSRNIRGLAESVSAPPPVANATTTSAAAAAGATIITTTAPTNKPTGVPTGAPTCAVNLPNNVTALTVVNLQFRSTFDDAIAVNTSLLVHQLTELFRVTYNRINDVKHTPCDEAYRKVTKVRHIDGSKPNGINDTSYTPSSFSFRRRHLEGGEEIDRDRGPQENTPSELATHYVRVGRSSDGRSREGGGRRMQQDQDSGTWMHISLLFEATIACRGMYCIGDNAELFGPVVINKNEFSKAYAKNVARSLIWNPSNETTHQNDSSGSVVTTISSNSNNNISSNSSSNNNGASPSPAPPTAFVVETVREIEEQSCPVGNQQIDFDKLVIVELVQDASSEPFANPDDPRFRAIEEAYVSTYNQLIRNEFCDPFFRRLTKSEVVAVGRGASTQLPTIVSVEMRIFGECRGCDPSDIDVYAIPSVLVGPTKASSSSSARSLFAETNSNDGDMWFLPSAKNVASDGRGLQAEHSNTEPNKCYCDAQPFGNRAPFEAEFVSRFQRVVEALNLPDVSSVNSCQFGTTFSTGLVVSFSHEDVRKLQETAGTQKSVLELSLKDTLNELLTVTNQNCNKDFRVIENVTMVLGTNITRSSPSYLGGESNSSQEDLNLRLPSSTGTGSTVQVATIKSATSASEISKRDAVMAWMGGDYRRSALEEDSNQQWKQPVVRIEDHPSSSSDETNCNDRVIHRSLLNENDTTTESNLTNIITNCNEAVSERSDSPTYSPFDPAIMGRTTDSFPILFFISGVCSGCDNSMFTGLGNDVLRKLGTTSVPPSPDVLQPLKYSRGLEEEEEERAKSDCFCPLNATETSGELEASVVSKAYAANLEKESLVDSEIEILDEVDVVECEDAVHEFETTATMTLAGDLNDSDIDALARTFQDTYNYLNTLYCDPYFREITSIEDYEVVTRRRSRKSRKLRECSTETEIELHIRGTCLGCDDGQPLFDGDDSHYNDRRKRNLKSLFTSNRLSTVYGTEGRRISRRRLQDSDVCFCEGDTIDDRAPSFDEFYSIYEEEALRVPEVCEVVEIEAEEEEEEDFSEDYGDEEFLDASKDYYEDFFHGSSDEEETVPPAFLIDDAWSEDLEENKEDVDEETSFLSRDGSEDLEENEEDVDEETSSSSRDESEDPEESEDDVDEDTSSSSRDESEDPEESEEDVDEDTSSLSGDTSTDIDDEESVDEEMPSLSGDASEDSEEDEDNGDQNTSSLSGDTSTDIDDEESVDEETPSLSGDASEDQEEDEDNGDQNTSSLSGDTSTDIDDNEESVDEETPSLSGDASEDQEEDEEDQGSSSSSGDTSADEDDSDRD